VIWRNLSLRNHLSVSRNSCTHTGASVSGLKSGLAALGVMAVIKSATSTWT
jgi:hypothetical protein